MIKNSEWGAVAYLSGSAYGRNGTKIDGIAEGDISGGGVGNFYITTGKMFSTTGNEYGIYDLNGSKSEYIAAYYNGKDANEQFISRGKSFASIGGSSTKYATTYNSSGASINSFKECYKYGDATYETLRIDYNNTFWLYNNNPFFYRPYGNEGLYSTMYNGGITYNNQSFRVILIV